MTTVVAQTIQTRTMDEIKVGDVVLLHSEAYVNDEGSLVTPTLHVTAEARDAGIESFVKIAGLDRNGAERELIEWKFGATVSVLVTRTYRY